MKNADIITDNWCRKNDSGSVTYQQKYSIDGKSYNVDGKSVILKPRAEELRIAYLLQERYGKNVELVPRVLSPPRIQTPDYFIDGKRYDLKSIEGRGKDIFRDRLKNKKAQADNYIFEITKCPLSDAEISKQIERIYLSKRTDFVNIIVLVQDSAVKKVYKRK